MKINTTFNIGDKAWFEVEGNQFTWGKIVSIDIKVTLNDYVECFYHIDNRFYDKDDYRVFTPYTYRNELKTERYITRKYGEVFSNKEDVIRYMKKKHQDKIESISELKKGLFRLF